MNSRFEYLYRSASNFKEWGAVVFSGVADEVVERRLVAALESFEFFIADQVRVPELFFQDGLDVGISRCWHEFVRLEPIDEEPTDEFSRSIESFVLEFEAAARAGWRIFDPAARDPERQRSSDIHRS